MASTNGGRRAVAIPEGNVRVCGIDITPTPHGYETPRLSFYGLVISRLSPLHHASLADAVEYVKAARGKASTAT